MAETIEIKCGYCDKPLYVPQGSIADRAGRVNLQKGQHDGFYVSPGQWIYCDDRCFVRFTED